MTIRKSNTPDENAGKNASSIGPPEREWMTKREVAEKFGITVRTVETYIARGDLRAYKLGSASLLVRINRADVLALLRPIASAADAN